MDAIRRDDLVELAARAGRWCVSIYLPAPDPGGGRGDVAATLLGLLRDAEERLYDRGLRTREVDLLLEPARQLARDPLFWRGGGTGIALFVSPSGTRVLRLPRRFPPRVDVAERHRIGPLVPLLEGPERFHVLALSDRRVRLLTASKEGVRDVPVDGMPRSLAEAVEADERQPSPFHHAASPPGGPFGPAPARGARGAGVRELKLDLERYFRRVDAVVARALGDETAPLVLAGVGFLLPIYREVNSYPHVLDGAIEANPDSTSDDELYRRGLRVVGPIVAATREAVSRSCRELMAKGSGRAVGALGDVLAAADAGRVSCLLVAAEARRWGRFDRTTGTVREHDGELPGDDDLVELAIVRTLETRGAVHVVEASEVPGPGPIAAVLRS